MDLTNWVCYEISFYVDENKTNRTMSLSLAKKNNNLSSNPNFTPVATYENPVIQKDSIYLENKVRAGI
jgi:hypothetical protein